MSTTMEITTEKDARDAGLQTYEELTACDHDGYSWGTVSIPKREVEPHYIGGKMFFHPNDCNEMDVDAYAERLPFDLSMIPAALLEQTARGYESGDIEALLLAFDGSEKLSFVQTNNLELKAVGMYETALVGAYLMGEFPHWRLVSLEQMFRDADRTKLRQTGSQMPNERGFTVYRGVAGSGRHRHVSGMSWTRSLDKAKWFANRNALADPAVYQTRVRQDDVYCYLAEREEEEFVFRAKWQKRMDIQIAPKLS